MLFERCREIRRGISDVSADLCNAFVSLHLQSPGASFQTDTLDKLIKRLIHVLFEHPHQMIFGIRTVSCHIFHINIAVDIVQYIIDRLIDHRTLYLRTVFLFLHKIILCSPLSFSAL